MARINEISGARRRHDQTPGQVLVRLDARDLSARVGQASQTVAAARARSDRDREAIPAHAETGQATASVSQSQFDAKPNLPGDTAQGRLFACGVRPPAKPAPAKPGPRSRLPSPGASSTATPSRATRRCLAKPILKVYDPAADAAWRLTCANRWRPSSSPA